MSEVKTSRTLLVSEVLRGDPCFEYSSKLGERFTDKIEVTVELALKQADDWDWYWAASRLLTVASYEKYTEIVNEAETAFADQLQPYRELARTAREQARTEYDRVLRIEIEKPNNWYTNEAYRAADKAYNEISEVSEMALDGARSVIRGRMAKVMAITFAELYIAEDGTKDETGLDRWYGRDEDYNDYEDDTDY